MWGDFGMGVNLCPIDISPLATLTKLCLAGMRRHKRGCRKQDTLVIKLFRYGGASFENSSDNPELKNELSSHTNEKHSPINIRDALYGGTTHATITYFGAKQGEEIHYVNVISLYPCICKYGKFHVRHPKV